MKMITRFWLPTMIVLALTVGVLTVSQLRTVFGSSPSW